MNTGTEITTQNQSFIPNVKVLPILSVSESLLCTSTLPGTILQGRFKIQNSVKLKIQEKYWSKEHKEGPGTLPSLNARAERQKTTAETGKGRRETGCEKNIHF